MSPKTYERKLTAILSADVAGYSRLMGEDEGSTVKTLETYKGVMFNLINDHRGRVVDSTGDNLLAEFGSVVNAVQCAVSVQKELQARNEEIPENRRMLFRIGINLGDVIEEKDRIYGDGVNIAARLESLADPGGVCISKTVFDYTENKLPLRYRYLGEQSVKNIAKPVGAYKVLMEPRVFEEEEKQEFKAVSSDKPSIVVLPFVNMSNDPDQEYFSDGMTEEIIGALAKLEGLKVISRTSAFYFKGQQVDLRTVGEKLKVDHVLEGSVRKAGNKLRIAAQLIRAVDDSHLWSETYDRELEDVFAIQEEISNAIVERLKVRILGKEKEPIVKTYTENMEAYESFIKGRYCFYSFSEGSIEKALQYYQQALTFDPNYAPAYSAIAEWYWVLPFVGGQDASEEGVYTKAMEAINRALEIDTNLPEAQSTLGLIRLVYEWDWKGAGEAFEKAIDLNPGSSKSHHDYAIYLGSIVGNFDQAVLEARKAVELDPLSGNAFFIFGACLFASGQFNQAIKHLRLAREMIPKHLPSVRALIWAYRKQGMLEEAMSEIKRGLELFPKEPQLLKQMGSIYALKGEKEKARAILDELLERSQKEYVPSLHIAILYADLGEMDQTFEYLEKGYEKREIEYVYIKLSPLSYLLRTEPRFIALLKKMRLEF